jgi:hypothetical protein
MSKKVEEFGIERPVRNYDLFDYDDGVLIMHKGYKGTTSYKYLTIVKMDQVDGQWVVYDTLGNIGDADGLYISRVGDLKYFVPNNFVKDDNGYIPIVFAVSKNRVVKYLNELECNKYFKNVTFNKENGNGSRSLGH